MPAIELAGRLRAGPAKTTSNATCERTAVPCRGATASNPPPHIPGRNHQNRDDISAITLHSIEFRKYNLICLLDGLCGMKHLA
jgi:hypothetical protein